MLLNVYVFVKDPFTDHAKFDTEKFQWAVYKAQRLMDDLVDLELEFVDKIIEKIENDPESDEVKLQELLLWKKIKSAGAGGRRTGLGVTGLGDALAAVGIRYGSKESVEFTYYLYEELAVRAYQSTIDMACERGPFPAFRYEKEKGHPFIERVLQAGGQGTRELYEDVGRRNIALTTTAPAGSVSILTQTTSGCEPAQLQAAS